MQDDATPTTPDDSCHQEFGFIEGQDAEFWSFLLGRGLIGGGNVDPE